MAYNRRKRKIKKNIPEAQAHIHATYNNTIVTISDKDGNAIHGLTSSDSNITLTVQEDTDGSISGVENTKYVMVISNVNVGGDVMVVPVYFLLCEQPTE